MIPISTDAPIYHLPIATVSTIVLNVICFIAFCLPHEASENMALVAPDGRVFTTDEQLEVEWNKFKTEEEAEKFFESLTPQSSGGDWVHTLSVEFGYFKPWQWVTNNFMHADWMHLIGNMIFLWAFGLIVEGKVGPFVFALLYLAIGTSYGFVLQSLSLVTGWDGIALGASAAIFGLLALCVAWAPANEFTVLLRFTTVEVSILLYGFLFAMKELGFWALGGFHMSSELLHIIGFATAMPIGLWMVTSGRVDCEGWDLFSYWAGKTGNESTVGKSKAKAREAVAAQKSKAQTAQQLLQEKTARAESMNRMYEQVTEAIDQGQIDTAIKLQNRITLSNTTATWRQKDLYRVVQALLKAKAYQSALPLLEKHIDMFEQSRFAMQSALMKIWLAQKEPQKTLRYLQGFNPSFMSPEEVAQLKQIAAVAKKQMAAGGQAAS